MEIKARRVKEKKFYVVFEGLCTGVYSSCENYASFVLGYSGCIYKSFATVNEAIETYKNYIQSRDQFIYESPLSNEGVDMFGEASNSISSFVPAKKKNRTRTDN